MVTERSLSALKRRPTARRARATPIVPTGPRRARASTARRAGETLPARPVWPDKVRLAAGDRRTQILAAAFEVFAERGFHGSRTRELAERAGVSEALVFSHFPTKEALIRAIIDQVGFAERIREFETRLGRMPPREALTALAEQVLTNLRDQPAIFRVVFFGLLETPELAGKFYHDFLSRILALETKLFARAFAGRKGRAAHVDPAIVARSFHGSLMFYNMAGAIIRIEPLPRDPAALARAIVNIYLPEGAR